MERPRQGLVHHMLKRKLSVDNDKKVKVLNALLDQNLLKGSVVNMIVTIYL